MLVCIQVRLYRLYKLYRYKQIHSNTLTEGGCHPPTGVLSIVLVFPLNKIIQLLKSEKRKKFLGGESNPEFLCNRQKRPPLSQGLSENMEGIHNTYTKYKNSIYPIKRGLDIPIKYIMYRCVPKGEGTESSCKKVQKPKFRLPTFPLLIL